MYIGCFCLLTFLSNVVSISFNPITSSIELSYHIPLRSNTAVANEGIFERFLRHLFDLLASPEFPGKKVIKLCKLLHKETSKIKNRYGKKLAKRLGRMAKMDRDEVKEEIEEFRKVLDNKLPARAEFLTAMNEVFTLRENLQFDDFIYDLRDYGTDDKLLMNDEARRLVHEVIVGSIHKMSARFQVDLQKRLKKAMKEYSADVDLGFLSAFDLLSPKSKEN